MEAKWSELFKRVPREEATAFRQMSDEDKISFLKRDSVPSKNLCLLLGLGEIVHDYPHQSVYHYEGKAKIQMDNGSVWTAEGIPRMGLVASSTVRATSASGYRRQNERDHRGHHYSDLQRRKS